MHPEIRMMLCTWLISAQKISVANHFQKGRWRSRRGKKWSCISSELSQVHYGPKQTKAFKEVHFLSFSVAPVCTNQKSHEQYLQHCLLPMSITTKCLHKACAWNNYLYSLKMHQEKTVFKIISGSWKGVKTTNLWLWYEKIKLQPHS